MLPKIVIINGTAGVGKDTFCDLCSQYKNVEVYSSIDCIKSAAMLMGWDGVKDERGRKFLSDLKDLSTKFNDFPFQNMKRFVADSLSFSGILFLMIREPKEIERAKKEFNAITVLIRNKNVAPVTGNHADENVEDYTYDYVVANNGTLADLGESARLFVEAIKG